jgi:hypothetical protein
MKKTIIIFIILLASLNTAADITSVDSKYSLLCEAEGVPGFKWKGDKWEATIFSGPKMTIVSKQDYEKSYEDEDFNDDKVVNRFCVGGQEGLITNTSSFIQDACYGFRNPGEEYSITSFTNCRETWTNNDDGSIKLKEVNCLETAYTSIKYDFQINGEFSAYKTEPYLGWNHNGDKDDIWMKLGTCNLL